MERVKNILVVCALLACVAPAMASDWFVDYAKDLTDNPANYNFGYYNPTPDPTAAADFAGAYMGLAEGGEYSQNTHPNPYYVYNNPATALPGINDTLRFQDVTTNRITLTTHLSVGTTYMGDHWAPLGNSQYPIFCTTPFDTLNGTSFSTETLYFGRNPDENFGGAAIHSIGNTVQWRTAGTTNIGELRVLNTDTQVRTNYSLEPLQTSLQIGPWHMFWQYHIDKASVKINIGDMYLNDTLVFLHANTGVWNLTGDIVEQGALAMILWGTENKGGPVLGDADGRTTLNIKWETLLSMIDNGQLAAAHEDGETRTMVNVPQWWGGTYRVGYEWDYEWWGTDTNAFPGNASQIVTRDNMYEKLDIRDIGDGMVQVHLIPEPATMVLLGLGAVAVFRRKR